MRSSSRTSHDPRPLPASAAAGNLATEARLEDYLVFGLIDYDDISYDDHAELLYKLSGQCIQHLRSVPQGRGRRVERPEGPSEGSGSLDLLPDAGPLPRGHGQLHGNDQQGLPDDPLPTLHPGIRPESPALPCPDRR